MSVIPKFENTGFYGRDKFGDTSIDVIKSVAICLASLGTVYFTKIHPILVIVVAGIIGYFIF